VGECCKETADAVPNYWKLGLELVRAGKTSERLRLPTGMRFKSSLVTKGREMVRQHRYECDTVTRSKNVRVCCNAGSTPATSTKFKLNINENISKSKTNDKRKIWKTSG